MPTITRLLLASAAALAVAPEARACSVCACGDPLLGATDPAAIAGRLRLQLDAEVLTVESAEVAGDPRNELTQWSYRVNAVYRPLEELTISATLPLTTKKLRSRDPAAGHASELTGLGDAELGARWTGWRSVSFGARRSQELALSVGTSLPTGSIRGRDRAGDLVDMHGQLGTGSWGPFAGVHYRLEQGDWAALASLSGRLRTESKLPGGDRYRYGDALLWSLHGQYRPVRWAALDLGLDGRSVQADRMNAAGLPREEVSGTGGSVWAVAPGAYLNAAGDLWLFLRAQLPVVKSLKGDQDVGPTVAAGVQLQLR